MPRTQEHRELHIPYEIKTLRKGNIIQNLINAAIFILLEIAALSMLNNNSQLQQAWFSRGTHAFMGAVWGGTQNIKDYFSLRKANDALALENYELRTRLARFEEAEEDYRSNEFGTPCAMVENFRYTPATIVKISNNTQHNYLIIGKGSKDGITVGSGVVTGKGAVGVIDAVSENYSYARSFRNYGMSISSRIGKTGSIGPMEWDGRSRNKAILKEIPHHMEFHAGDTIYTSGYSSIFPADIPLGTVGETRIVNGATYEITVELFEDFGALRYVTIVDNTGQEEMKRLEEGQR